MLVYRFFPKSAEIDRNRLPDIGVIENSMLSVGFQCASHETVVQKVVSSVDELIEKMKRKFISALTFLSDEEIDEGLRRMEAHFRTIGPEAALVEVSTEPMTLVCAEK